MIPLTRPTRRRFLRQLVVGSAAVGGLGSLTACGGGGDGGDDDAPADATFAHGVASGDPLSDRVILWTHVSTTAAGSVSLRWQVASDEAFTSLVAEGTTSTDASVDHTVKVDATGLSPATAYWYRFGVGEQWSPVGRTKTLPVGDVAQVKLGVFSCANYPSGYFNAYAHAAARGDLDVAVLLGDYIYEYERGGYGTTGETTLGRLVDPPGETLSLSDYRTRYAQYHADPDLIALHAALPVIAVWDDHEFANDAWRDGAGNHEPEEEGDYATRKAAAIQAYHEWLPTRVTAPDQIYRSFDFGSLLSLHMLDTRIVGRDEQLEFDEYFDGLGYDFDALQAAIDDPNRQLLGATQMQWLQARLQTSTATWQVLGQQVLMARMQIPAAVATQQIGVSAYAELMVRAQTNPASLTPQEQALVALPTVPYNLDAWDGYGAAREAVFNAARDLDRNLVVLAGDTHNAWANDLRDTLGQPVGVEFAVSSVTSPGMEFFLPGEIPENLASSLTDLIDPLKWCDTSRRGYLVLTATAGACQGDWIFVDTIDTRSTAVQVARSLATLPGAGGRRLVEVAPV